MGKKRTLGKDRELRRDRQFYQAAYPKIREALTPELQKQALARCRTAISRQRIRKSMRRTSDEKLIDQFVEAFEVLSDRTMPSKSEAPPDELDDGADDSQWAWPKWKPARIRTPRVELDQFRSKFGVSLPELYENLVLSYRWLEVDLPGMATLFANPPGPLSAGILAVILADSFHRKILLPAGFVPFARAQGGDFDQICFDTTDRSVLPDFPVVRIDHESLICDEHINKRSERWDSFRSFAEAAVMAAEMKSLASQRREKPAKGRGAADPSRSR